MNVDKQNMTHCTEKHYCNNDGQQIKLYLTLSPLTFTVRTKMKI